ncbi:hypothetical protein E2C01_096981 [Portunus trituberculatus]|uniref:Uncharacterized protein n=1 Tax=Portunus trituberculatus TaxID=210409 RepID=A0A5B7K4B6_PORTR|nr:hypothetical protein [Portunus trituberculatus]
MLCREESLGKNLMELRHPEGGGGRRVKRVRDCSLLQGLPESCQRGNAPVEARGWLTSPNCILTTGRAGSVQPRRWRRPKLVDTAD